MAVLGEAGNMAGGKGAAVGDHEQAVRQRQLLAQQLEVFVDGGVAVLVAADHVGENRHSAESVDHGGGADLDHFLIFGEVAMGDVGGVDERGSRGW